MGKQATILETMDYGKFALHEFNRDVRKIERLVNSMKCWGWIDAYPMHCERNGPGKLSIKGGHHRFEAAKIVGIPVKYVVTSPGPEVHELEFSNRAWTLEDFVVSNVRGGLDDFVQLHRLHSQTGIGLLQCAQMLSGQAAAGGGNLRGKVISGKFQIKEVAHFVLVADLVDHLKSCGIDWATNSRLVGALSKAAFVKEFDAQRFKAKASQHTYLIEKQADIHGYLAMIEAIYNRQTSDKTPLAFLANQTAKTRNIARKRAQE